MRCGAVRGGEVCALCLWQLLPQAELAVDTFFYLSGFLAAHSMAKRLTKMTGAGRDAPACLYVRCLLLTQRRDRRGAR